MVIRCRMLLVAVIVTTLLLLPAQTAQADDAAAATSAAALTADPAGGATNVVYRGPASDVLYRTLSGATWSAPTSLGGKIIGAPGAAASGGRLAVVARGLDSALWTRIRNGGVWGGWQRLGGVLSTGPTAAAAADGTLYVFVRGRDDKLWAKVLSPTTGWSGWQDLAGTLASGAAAAVVGDGTVEVFIAGSDHAVWRKTLSGGQWSGWSSLGGRTYSAPAVAWDAVHHQLHVLVRGTNNVLYDRIASGGAWSPTWANLGGVVVDAPGATATTAGAVQVVVRGANRALYSKTYQAGTWSAYARAWLPSQPPPPAAALRGIDWERIPTTAKVVALTLDAGGNADGLASIRATLQRKNVPATFFLTGAWVRTFPDRANEVAVAGFRIANHSMTHPHFTQLTDEQVRAEVLGAQTAILEANGADPRPLFRFPYGDRTSHDIALLNDLGYVPVRWTVDTLGWKGTSGGVTTSQVVSRVLAALQPGEIVLMHVGSNPDDRSTLDADALPTVIDQVRARGYSFVTLDALLG